MRTSSIALLLVGFIGVAHAQEAPAEPQAEHSIAGIRAELAAALKHGADKQQRIDELTALIKNAAIMVDSRQDDAQRIAAVEALGQSADPRVLPLLWATSHTESAAVRAATIRASIRWDSAEVIDLLVARARTFFETQDNQVLALQTLGGMGQPSAARALYGLAQDKSIAQPIRVRSIAMLEAHYPEYLNTHQRPSVGGDMTGHVAAISGNALVGGITLGSVGVWGQGEAAQTIGALGGAGIGAGTAVIYTQSNPLTRGEGVAYASNVAWGLAGGMMATQAIYGNQGPPAYDGDIDNRNMAALLRTTGVGIGAFTGYRRIDQHPEISDVWEVNAAGGLGALTASSAVGVVQSFSDIDSDCDLQPSHAVDACYRSEERRDAQRSQARAGVALGGAAVGLTLGTLAQEAWSPAGSDALFAGVLGVESLVLASQLRALIDPSLEFGDFANLGLMTGTAAGLLITHHNPVSIEQTALMGYGVVGGNTLGGGIGLLLGEDTSTRSRSLISMTTGIAGTATGAWSAKHLNPSTGDWTMVGVGTALSAAQLGATTFVLSEKGVLTDEDQFPGVILTGSTLASMGFLAATKKSEPQPLDAGLLASTTAWGALYGSVGQLAVDANLSDANAVMVTTLVADAGLGAGMFIISDKTSVTPRDTLVPQLFGVTGATLGALGSMLATEDAQPIAIGTLSGSTLGLVAGSILAPKLQSKSRQARRPWLILPMANIDPPGQWSFSAVPAVQPDGQVGAAFSLRGRAL